MLVRAHHIMYRVVCKKFSPQVKILFLFKMDDIVPTKRLSAETRLYHIENKLNKLEKQTTTGEGIAFDGNLNGNLTVKGSGQSEIKGSLLVKSGLTVEGAFLTQGVTSPSADFVVNNNLVANSLETTSGGNLKIGGSCWITGIKKDTVAVGGLIVADKNIVDSINVLEDKTTKISYSGSETKISGNLKLENKESTTTNFPILYTHSVVGSVKNGYVGLNLVTSDVNSTVTGSGSEKDTGNCVIKTGTTLAQSTLRKSGDVVIETGAVGNNGTTGDIVLSTGIKQLGEGDVSFTRGCVNISGRDIKMSGNVYVNNVLIPLNIQGEAITAESEYAELLGKNLVIPNGGKITMGSVELGVANGHLTIDGVEVWSEGGK